MNNQVIYINGEINDKLIAEFIDKYNKLDSSNSVDIFINSEGGDIAHSLIIIEMIEKLSNVSLYAVGEIQSAGFDIFFFTKCKNKYILPGTMGMAHLAWAYVATNEDGRPTDDFGRFFLQELKKNKSIRFEQIKELGLIDKELQKIKRGDNCYFTYERLNELLDGQKN